MRLFESKFDLGENVLIDGDKDMIVTVSEICFGKGVECKVCWWLNGEVKEYWVSEWRLSRA